MSGPRPFPPFWRGPGAILAIALWLHACAAHAADPVPYTVNLPNTGNSALDSVLKDSSNLSTLREQAPVGPFALVTRARDDVPRLETALHSFGFYAGHATIRIAGKPLDDQTLPDVLAALPGATPAAVDVSVDTGPLFHLRRVSLTGEAPPGSASKLNLASGAPAVAADVLAARDRLLGALLEDGHALAKVDPPVAVLDPQAQVLDVTYHVEAGPRVNIGPIAVEGLERVDESYVRRRLLLHEGEPFKPSTIEEARQDLAAVGVFSGVQARAANQLNPQGQIPIVFSVAERARRAVAISASFSTDQGGSVSATWTHRNLFGSAEQLNLGVSATQLGGTATRRPGYSATAQLIKPDFLTRDQALQFDLQALKESLDAYDRTAFIGDVLLTRKFSKQWSASTGLSFTQERVTQEAVGRTYHLLALPITVKYDTSNSLFDPTEGVRLSAQVTPTANVGSRSSTFVIAQLSGSTYLNIDGDGRSVLALRALVGTTQGATTFQLPPDQRFYAGGGGTVRGFKYQSIGPQFPDTKPIGGTSISVGSIEFRQRFLESFGAAVFADGGTVSSRSAPFQGKLRIGAGAGLRYYTPIGPIRLDFAVPLNKGPGGDKFELYLGIGQAF